MPTKKKSKSQSSSSASRSVITSFNSSSQSDEIINNIFEVVTKDSKTNHQSSTREMRDIGTMTNSFDRGDNSSLLFDNSSNSNANNVLNLNIASVHQPRDFSSITICFDRHDPPHSLVENFLNSPTDNFVNLNIQSHRQPREIGSITITFDRRVSSHSLSENPSNSNTNNSENVTVPCNSSERDRTTLVVDHRDEIEISNIDNPSEISFWKKCLANTDGVPIESAIAASMIDLIEENSIPSGEQEKKINPKSKIRKECSNSISNPDIKALIEENERYKEEIEMYKTQWMPKPCDAAAAYIIDTAKILSPAFNQEEIEKKNQIEQIKREKQIDEISRVLELSVTELKECVRTDDITKTCRELTRAVYKDISMRSTMLVSQIPFHIIQAIHSFAKLAHPNQSGVKDHILNNAIGNVFSTTKPPQSKKRRRK